MSYKYALAAAAGGIMLWSAAASAQPTLPACDSPEARTGVNIAWQKLNTPYTISSVAGITTDRQTSTEIACLAIATLSNGSHRPIGYKFRIYDGKLQSWVGVFVMKDAR